MMNYLVFLLGDEIFLRGKVGESHAANGVVWKKRLDLWENYYYGILLKTLAIW